jgi:hypothetical protein
MVVNETLSRVRRLDECRGASHGRTESGDTTSRSEVSKTGRLEPAKTRAETQGQAFRGPRLENAALLPLASEVVQVNDHIVRRARDLQGAGYGAFDALQFGLCGSGGG